MILMSLYMEGTGLISRDGILKPSGHACHFMHRFVQPMRLSRDANILVNNQWPGRLWSRMP